MVTLVKILNGKSGQKQALCVAATPPISEFSLQTSAETKWWGGTPARDSKASPTFLFLPSDDLLFLELTCPTHFCSGFCTEVPILPSRSVGSERFFFLLDFLFYKVLLIKVQQSHGASES